MTDLWIFAVFLIAGIGCRRQASCLSAAKPLNRAAYATLLLFTTLLLWRVGLPGQAWWLIGVGMLMQAVPTMIGSRAKDAATRHAFLIFATYGGGNRGSLALALLAPSLLPVFVLVDMGNFISLILLFPLMSKDRDRLEKHAPTRLTPLYWGLSAMLLGLLLHHQTPFGAAAESFEMPVKWLLIALTSFQVGSALNFNKSCVVWVMRHFWMVRLLAIIVSSATALALPSIPWQQSLAVLAVFAMLPVSSLAPSLLPPDANAELRGKVACAITVTSALYLGLLLLALAIFHAY